MQRSSTKWLYSGAPLLYSVGLAITRSIVRRRMRRLNWKCNAQISALRMQLNPHFLFNTMNSISSLMRTDIDAADTMLEQLGSLLRITLERGDAQLISLRD